MGFKYFIFSIFLTLSYSNLYICLRKRVLYMRTCIFLEYFIFTFLLLFCNSLISPQASLLERINQYFYT